ncbi:MAG TPA: DUF5916 domain-containing protein, partial [Longimicrobium sp.]|nr:DUF5916 domain-containing protein [Longimicrobium sp.]
DTYLDRRTAYNFGVSAAGVRTDWYNAGDDENDRDWTFDPVWEAKVQRDSLGWTAELRIPYSQVRFVDLPRQTWGINVNRWIGAREEDDYWMPVPRNVTAWSSRFGELTGLDGIRPPRRVELMPYVAAGATVRGDPARDDPFADRAEGSARMGGDARVGLGSNLTLEATVNPDFGQVEADPAEVNLSAYETFFSEKRPFFIEGSQLLAGGGPTWFYSRRIGQAPRCRAVGTFRDCPESATILGAAKLTGRLASGTSIGALAALTDAEELRYYRADSAVFRSLRVAPRTGYAVLRGQQEFGRDKSTVGLTVTGVRRDLGDDDALRSLLARDAVTGGADWNLRFRGGEYVVSGYLGASRVAGDSAAVLLLQTAPARYFQRPDADHVALDPSRTALGGWSGGLGVEKQSGKHWLWEVYASAEAPGFDLNDAGALSTADEVFGMAELTYRETRPASFYRNYSVGLTTENIWDFAGVKTFGTIRTDASLTLKNYWIANLTAWRDFAGQDNYATRGGPRMGTAPAWVVIGQLANRASAPTRWRGRVYYGRNDAGDLTYRISGGLALTPSPRVRVSVDPNYLRYVNPRQYVTTLPGGPAATFGERYLFSFIDQSTLLAQVRMSYTFTPDLSLELYAEPFASSGRYYRFGELPKPGSRELNFYGENGFVRSDDGTHSVYAGTEDETVVAQDFNVRSFRSNAVLRWEWRPGSTLYLVWQQDRAADTLGGRRVGLGSLGETFDAPGDNFLALKVTYWLPMR